MWDSWGPHKWVFFSTFVLLTFLWRLVALNAHHLEHALDQPRKVRATLKTKECSPKAWRSISRVPVADFWNFTLNLMQLLEFVSHCNERREVLKQGHKTTCANWKYVDKRQTDSAVLGNNDIYCPERICGKPSTVRELSDTISFADYWIRVRLFVLYHTFLCLIIWYLDDQKYWPLCQRASYRS